MANPLMAAKQVPYHRIQNLDTLTTHIHTPWNRNSGLPRTDDGELLPAAAQVLGNDDLLHEMFQHCPRESIQNLRLSWRHFEPVASGYLFRTIPVGFRKRYARRLQRISRTERFAKGVREIVWERVSYGHDSSVAPLVVLALRACGIDTRELEPWKLKRAESKAQRFVDDEKDLTISLVPGYLDAFKQFSNIQRAVLTQWRPRSADRHSRFMDLSAILGHTRTALPPLLSVGEDITESAIRGLVASAYLLAALMMGGHMLRDFAVESTDKTLNCFPGMMFIFRCLDPSLTRSAF